jgi:hypothetical protein
MTNQNLYGSQQQQQQQRMQMMQQQQVNSAQTKVPDCVMKDEQPRRSILDFF